MWLKSGRAGKSLSGDVTAGTGKFFVDVDAEQIVEWNPDLIFPDQHDRRA